AARASASMRAARSARIIAWAAARSEGSDSAADMTHGITSTTTCKAKSSACRRRSPGLLRHAPVNAFEQIAELGRRDRDRAVGRRWPDEAAALELLREQAGALAVVPQNLDQIAASAAED